MYIMKYFEKRLHVTLATVHFNSCLIHCKDNGKDNGLRPCAFIYCNVVPNFFADGEGNNLYFIQSIVI